MTPVKAIALMLARKDSDAGNWYMRLAECAPEITWDDVERLRDFTPRRTAISVAVQVALA